MKKALLFTLALLVALSSALFYANAEATEVIVTALETRYMRLQIAPDGRVLGLCDKSTGENFAHGDTYLVTLDGQNPVDAQFADGVATFTFEGGTAVRFRYEAFDGFLTLELLDEIAGTVRFFNIHLTKAAASDGDFAVTLYAMTYQTDVSVFPDGKALELSGAAYGKFEPVGAKIALVAGPRAKLRGLLQSVNEALDKTKIGYSALGGANAMDHACNYGDYMIVHDSSRLAVPEYIQLCKTYGIDQVDFHQGENTFFNGSFAPRKYLSYKAFRANVTDRLKAAGVQSGLHTYAFYIDARDPMLRDPKWQRQLGVLSTMTLTEDLWCLGQTLRVDDASAVVPIDNWFDRNSKYLLIDEEIVEITSYGKEKLTVKRAAAGTKRARHKAGAQIKHLDGWVGMLAPDLDSELFLQVARNTARAYNEGGFGMIYLDALDGLWTFVGADKWYYGAKFVNEILQNCDNSPIMEFSDMSAHLWLSRSRMNAWDYPTCGYKEWNRTHVDNNKTFTDCFLPTTLGWYSFAPEGAENAARKYQFSDDIDYMGSLAVAYDMSMVFNPAPTKNSSAFYRRNASHYADVYSMLRKTDYFPEGVKEVIRDTPEKEYAAMRKSDGAWGMFEKYYLKEKLYDINAPGRSEIKGTNPFGEQSPFIRIEGHASSAGGNGITLMEFDENQDLNSQMGKAAFSGEIDLTNHRALTIRVLGNNSGDALCVRLSRKLYGNPSPNLCDYLIKLDFEGWREFILAEHDNGDLLQYGFPRAPWDIYDYFRADAGPEEAFKRVCDVALFKSGDCEGVRVSSIVAKPRAGSVLKNPSIQIGGATVTFQTSISETQYLEYTPGSAAAKLYSQNGAAADVKVTSTGELKLPPGDFTAVVSAGKAAMPLRATVTFGFTGPEVVA